MARTSRVRPGQRRIFNSRKGRDRFKQVTGIDRLQSLKGMAQLMFESMADPPILVEATEEQPDEPPIDGQVQEDSQ